MFNTEISSKQKFMSNIVPKYNEDLLYYMFVYLYCLCLLKFICKYAFYNLSAVNCMQEVLILSECHNMLFLFIFCFLSFGRIDMCLCIFSKFLVRWLEKTHKNNNCIKDNLRKNLSIRLFF